MRNRKWLATTSVLFMFLACTEVAKDENKQTTEQKIEKKDPAIRLELSIGNRLVHVLKGQDTIRTFAIAVGMPKYPTPEGEFKIHQIDWNPDWTPPDSEWSKDEKHTPPSHPDNPMGRVRIIYQSPYSLHGTKDLASLREAESHGSVRLANKDVIELARIIMEESGQGKPAEWYQQVLNDSTKMQTIKLTDSIPLTNRR